MDEYVIVEPGHKVTFENGQSLEVTDATAVGKSGKTYCTAPWKASTDADRAAWKNRNAWRRFWGLQPKGYPKHQSISQMPFWQFW